MEPRELTCDEVDNEDLDTRYLAGTLPAADAEAFEAHYFACERCWQTVRLGLAVRGAESAAPQATGPETTLHRDVAPGELPRRGRHWWPLLAAASVAIVAVGTWRTLEQRRMPDGEPIERGAVAPMRLVAGTDGGAVAAAWARVEGATLYRARLTTADGAFVAERETTDTAVAIAPDSLRVASGTTLLWQVRALDRLRATLATSSLVEVRVPPSEPVGGRSP